MEKYVYKNPYVLPKEQKEEREIKNEKEIEVPEPKKKEKVKVDLLLPKKLADAIGALSLSDIMKNKCLKLADRITHKALTEHKDLGAFVPLSKNYLKKTFNHDYLEDFLKTMKHMKIIECDERYQQGNAKKKGECKSYRINRRLLAGEFVIVSYNDKRKDDITVDQIHLPQRDESDTNDNRYKGDIEDSNSSLSKSSPPIPISGRFFKRDDSALFSPRFLKEEERPLFIPRFFYNDGTPLFSPRFSDRRQVIEDLGVLSYDPARIMEKAKEHAKSIGSEFLVDEEVVTRYFEVVNKITGTEYFTTREQALTWCRNRNVSLIQDDREFYIDDLDTFIQNKQQRFLDCCRWQLAKLANRLFYAQPNDTNNRLDHNLTNISKHVLQAIKEDNDLVEIDLKNSQFAIYAFWLKEEGLCELHEDVRQYYQLCTTGLLYDEIGKRKDVDRKKAKMLMMELAFSSERHHSSQKKWLKEIFPNVVHHIDEFKKQNGSNAFAVELQKRESRIFIDNLYPCIKELNIFCLPKHDSFLIRRQNADVVIELMQSFFQQIGFECVLDIEGKRHVIQNK